jgi:peptidoglycan/LPS O-acetylase OafA/YrhL
MPLLKTGQHGVDLFFVISGFCLSYPILARHAAGFATRLNVPDFAAKRLVRIFPPFLAALAFFVVWSYHPSWQLLVGSKSVAPSYPWTDTIREAFLIDGRQLHNGSFWSLAVELRWYAIFPFALALFLRWPLAFVPISVLAWVAYYFGFNASKDALMLPAFLLGIVAAYAATRRPPWVMIAPVLLAVAGVSTILISLHTDSPLWQVFAFTFVLSVVASKAAQRALSWGPIVAVGAASYSIYLIHQPIVLALEDYRVPWYLAMPIALACGFQFWRLVERPLLQPDRRRWMVNLLLRVFRALRPERAPAARIDGTTRPSIAR